MLVIVLSLAFYAAGCGDQQKQAASGQKETVPQSGDVNADLPEDTQEDAGQLQQDIQQAAGDLAEKAQTLLGKAKQYLDAGKFDEAISLAQDVLSFDPQNIDAQRIVEMAKAKVKALADQTAQDLKVNVINNLKGTGQ